MKKREKQIEEAAVKYEQKYKHGKPCGSFHDGAVWADSHRPVSEPVRITEMEPEMGQLFIGAAYSPNKGYQLQYCYRDDDGFYHDIIAELDMRLFVARMKLLPEGKIPGWVLDIKENDMKMREGPDYWWPLPTNRQLESLPIYDGSPTAKTLKKDTEDYKSYEVLRKIEDEMNSSHDG